MVEKFFMQKKQFLIQKCILFIPLFLFFILFPQNIFPEWRTYQSKQKIAFVLENFLKNLEETKVSFSVVKVYNEKEDGVQGFEMLLRPQGTISKVQFFEEIKTKYTLVKIFTQNNTDGYLFEKVFLEKMKMKEVGVTPIQKDKSWQDKMQ